MKKGISDLIGAVLLIAFVIAAASILSGWFLGFTKEKAQQSQEKGGQSITCTFASLSIKEAKWNNTNKRLSLTILNTGSEKLSNFKMSVIYDNNTADTIAVNPVSTTLDPGALQVYYNETNVGPTCTDVTRVRLYSETCPVDATDEVKEADITSC